MLTVSGPAHGKYVGMIMSRMGKRRLFVPLTGCEYGICPVSLTRLRIHSLAQTALLV